ALIITLAQMGSFVPAASARLAITDRIFTRVGAADNLARGRSTFMVEMTETANILNTATPRSLVLLDEVGRGTATFDGLSIAWAIAEYLHDSSHHSAKTLFATHYHEMTELSKLRPGVRNYQVAVSERGGEIVFLRKVIPGSASKSYGIEVARLAGLPMTVVERAREILVNLEQNELDPAGKPKFARHLKKPSARQNQISLFGGDGTVEDPAEDASTLVRYRERERPGAGRESASDRHPVARAPGTGLPRVPMLCIQPVTICPSGNPSAGCSHSHLMIFRSSTKIA